MQARLCKHDRGGEELLTVPYARALGGLLIREFGVRTGSWRWIDGLVIHEDRNGRALDGDVCWKCAFQQGRHRELERLAVGSRATLIQTKRASFGMALAGQAMLAAMLVHERFTRALDVVALCQGEHAALSRALGSTAPDVDVRVEIASIEGGRYRYGRPEPVAPDRGSRQPRPAPRLVEQVAARYGLGAAKPRSVGEVGELAEAVFETPSGLTIVHSQQGTVGLALAGRVVCSRALLAAQMPTRGVRSLGVATTPDAVVASLIRRFEGCDVVEL